AGGTTRSTTATERRQIMGIRRILGLDHIPSKAESIAATERLLADQRQWLAEERERLRRIEALEDQRSCRTTTRANIRIAEDNVRELERSREHSRRRWFSPPHCPERPAPGFHAWAGRLP